MMFSAIDRIELLDSFEALKEALNSFRKIFCSQAEKTLPGWFQPPRHLPLPLCSTRERAFAFFNQLEYLNVQEPREILIGPGVFAASGDVLEAIQYLNQCKERFKKAVLDLKKTKIPLSHSEFTQYFETSLGKRSPRLVESFRKMGFARLHLKQCYRLIPCLVKRPSAVSWTWAHTKAIKRITVQEAEQLLMKQGSDLGIERQLSKLYSLSPKEPLAIVQNLAPHLRANITFQQGDETKRIMVKGAVPLFYPSSEGDILPDLYPAFEKQGINEERAIRSDVKLEPTPFLQAIRVHRYLTPKAIAS